MNKAQTFKRRPIEVEAMRWGDGLSREYDQIGRVIDWVLTNGGTAVFVDTHPDLPQYDELHVHTLDGTSIAGRGFWIVKRDDGQFFPCPPDVFEETYERA